MTRIMIGIWHGLLLHKSLDPEIDINPCSKSMRDLYRGIFGASEQAV